MSGVDILTAAELASIRREYRGAIAAAGARLPRRTRSSTGSASDIVRRDWVMVARVEDVARPGSFKLVELDGEHLILVRGRDDVIRAFYNVCRHRGTAVSRSASAARPSASSARTTPGSTTSTASSSGPSTPRTSTTSASTPSGWRRSTPATWQGFVFLNLADGEVAPLEDQLGDLVEHFARFDFSTLRSREAHRLRRRPRTGSSSPRTTASATTARASTRSSTS